MKVLVVNDDRIQAAILKRLLLADHEVETVYDTERAWQKIADWEPDVLVVDWLMPKLAGVELTKRIRSTPSHKHLYILMVSTRLTPADVDHAFSSGVDDFMRQPVSRSELLARVMGAQRLRGIVERAVRDESGTHPHQQMAEVIDSLAAWKRVEAIVRDDLASMLDLSFELGPWVEPPSTAHGATIRLSQPASRLDVKFTLLADDAALAFLGETVLGIQVSPEGAHDLLFEMVNVAAGAFKRELIAANIDLTLGLPAAVGAGAASASLEGARAVRRAVMRVGTIAIFCTVSVAQQPNEVVAAHKLQEGMVVVRAVCNDSGALLVPAGTRITSSTATRIAAALGEKLIEVSPLAA